MQRTHILSDEQFGQLTTEQKYVYINEMLRHIVQSRTGSTGQPVGERLERVAHRLNDADYACLSDAEKIRYLENVIAELVSTVAETQRALVSLRTAASPPLR